MFGYAVNRGSTTLSIVKVDLRDGSLTETSASPFDLGAMPYFADIDPSGARLFVTSRQTGRIYSLRIDPDTGALTPIADAIASPWPAMVVAHPNGRWLYVADYAASPGQVLGYTIDDGGV